MYNLPMFRLFYIDRDPDYYNDLICWLPEYCTLHNLLLQDIESRLPPLKWETDILLINPEYTGHSVDFLSELIERLLPVPLIFLSDTTELPFVVSLMKTGAHSFLNKRKDKSILIETIKQIIYNMPDHSDSESEILLPELVGTSSHIQKLKKDIIRLRSSSIHIHLTGETGTGKEMAARAIHKCRSDQKKKLFALNCGSLAENLVESELFGTRKGAFTDAVERAGLFETADGSTLMLDEVSELSKTAQVKLLRVLEYGTFNRVGGTKELKSDFQLITASNRNLRDEVSKGNFREDLFYRITTLIINIPPLRARKEDIGELSRHFLKINKSERKITAGAMNKLKDHSWPGNIRELKQVIERADHFSWQNKAIEPKHIVFY